MKKAVILLSGGLDSTVTLYLAKEAGYKVYGLTFNYGQRHKKEIEAAKKISRRIKVPLEIVKIKLPWLKDALTDKRKHLPMRNLEEIPRQIPSTYVAARNTIFLSFAVSFAESIGAGTIFIGANALDWSGYPDCTPEYFRAWEKVIERGTKTGIKGKRIKIKVPLVRKTKADIVKLGEKTGVPFELTWSCYEGGKFPCGKCDTCLLRAKGFKMAGIKDPAVKQIFKNETERKNS